VYKSMANENRTLIQQFRENLNLKEEKIYLDNASVAPLSIPAQKAINAFTHSQGVEAFDAIEEFIESYENARASFAKITGAQPDDTAMMQTCAAAISQVAFGLELKEGEEIILLDQEYPSNAYPWYAAAKEARAKVISISSTEDFEIPYEKILKEIGPRTRVLAISWVQFRTGAVADLKLLADAVHAQDGWLVVDVIQGLGVLPFDLKKFGVDAVCGGTHKWLCGPIGHGFLALAPKKALELKPLLYGTFTYGFPDDLVDPKRAPHPNARRFEPGSPPLAGALGGAASIEMLLGLGIENIYRHTNALADQLAQGLRERDFKVFRTLKTKELRSPIVTFEIKEEKREKTIKALEQAKVSYTARFDLIRLAPHGYNSSEEIQNVLEFLNFS
jgi:cysteine desulfurase / selenocysteine lyase